MQTRTKLFGQSLLLFGLCQGLLGCAPAASQLTGAAVEGAVETVEEPENLERIEEIATDPRFQDAVESTSAALTRGAVAGVAGRDLNPAVEDLGASLARGLTRGISEEIGDISLPQPGAVVGNVVDSAIRSASAPDNRERTQLIISDISEAMVRSITASLADGIREDIRPAFSGVSDGAAPMVATALDNTGLRHALGAMVHEVSRQSALGVEAAMDQIAEENRAQQEGILGRVSIIGWAILASLGLLLLGAIIAIIVLAVRNVRSRNMIAEEHRNREHMLTSLLATSAAASEGGLDEGTRSVLLRYLGAEDARGARKPKPPQPDASGDQGPSPSGLAPAE